MSLEQDLERVRAEVDGVLLQQGGRDHPYLLILLKGGIEYQIPAEQGDTLADLLAVAAANLHALSPEAWPWHWSRALP